MTQPNFTLRRRVFVQVSLWIVLLIILGAIIFIGCGTPEPDQSHKPLPDVQPENYSKTDWTDPQQRLDVAIQALRQAEEQITRLEQIQHKYPTTERTQNLAEFHKIRVQLLFQIAAEAQNIQWRKND